MNALQITLVLIIITVAVFGVTVLRRTDPPPKQANSQALRLGPIRHVQLPDELISRIHAFEPVFAEVYPNTHEQWVEGFQRDLHPKNEVAIWEHIAAAYTQFTSGRELPLDLRMEAFGILLVRSGGTDETMLYSRLKFLTLDEARKLVSFYSAPPQPIQVQQQ